MSEKERSEEHVKSGAELLLKGAEMLNKACPQCRSPLYKYQDRIICPSCKKNYKFVETSEELEQIKMAQKHQQSNLTSNAIQSTQISSRNDVIISSHSFEQTAKILQKKIQQINNKLETSVDPNEIKELSEALNSLIKALKQL